GREDHEDQPGGGRRTPEVRHGVRREVPDRRQREAHRRRAGGEREWRQAVSGAGNRLREWFDKLAPRERRMMGVLGVFLVLFLLFLIPLGVSLALGSRRDANRSLREAIHAVKNAREDV